MDVEPVITDGGHGETRVAVHPLAIVHMSDQYTRISSGGSPLDNTAPVVGLLFGLCDNNSNTNNDDDNNKNKNNNNSSHAKCNQDDSFIQVLDADDIPVDVSDASTLQVDLHMAVFPKHKVVGWYRVSVENEEPTSDDLSITQILKEHYAPSDLFCFCLLKVQSTTQQQNRDDGIAADDEMKMSDDDVERVTTTDTLSKDLPINLYEIYNIKNKGSPILIGLSNWELDTSPSERISIERVMKDRPSELGDGVGVSSNNPYILETKAMQHSLTSMKDRVHVLVSYLEDVQIGKSIADPIVLRQIQQIVSSLGPLSSLANTSNEGEDDDVQMLAHLAIVARTVNTIQSYTEKFRVMNESRTLSKEMRRPF